MNMLRQRLRLIVLIVLVACPAAAWAQGVCADQAPPQTVADSGFAFAKLLALYGKDCLGGQADTSELTGDVRKMLVPNPKADEPLLDPAKAALSSIGAYATSQAGKPGGEPFTNAAQQVALVTVMLGTNTSPARPDAWAPDAGRIPALSLPLESSLATACKPAPPTPAAPPAVPPTCGPQFELVKELLRVSRLTKSALDFYVRPVIVSFQKDTKIRAAKWDAYFDTARSQYPWELLLNGAFMKDTRPVVDGVAVGFREVPTGQVLFLHPDVVFEYADDEPDGSRFAGAVVVDLIGYNRWSWKADGSMGFAIGASAIISLGDHVNMDDIGWGGMLHVNNKWSVGMTFGSGKQTVLVSADVAQLWNKVSEVRKKRLSTLQ